MDTDSSEEIENLENPFAHLHVSDGTSLSLAHTIGELPKSPVSKASALHAQRRGGLHHAQQP
jgi:hypothetical protein